MGRKVSEEVEAMVRERGIAVAAAPTDALAAAITAHAGDDVALDATVEGIVALQRAGAIGGAEATRMHAAHIRERRAG